MRGSAGGADEDRTDPAAQSVSQSVRPTNSKYLTRDNLRQSQTISIFNKKKYPHFSIRGRSKNLVIYFSRIR